MKKTNWRKELDACSRDMKAARIFRGLAEKFTELTDKYSESGINHYRLAVASMDEKDREKIEFVKA